MRIDGRFRVDAPPAAVLGHLFDARLMASCLPGCESLEAIDDDRYRAVVAFAMAGIKARFDLVVEVTAREADGIRAVTRGEEGGQASTLQATSEVKLAPDGDGTAVDYVSEVAITGRLGRFALGMMKKKAQAMGDEFAANLQAKLAEAPSAPVTSPTAASAATSTSTSTPMPMPSVVQPSAPVAGLDPWHVADEPVPTAPPKADAAPSRDVAVPARLSIVQRIAAWLRRLFGGADAPRRAER